jgi:hypothetical protein
MPDVEGSKKQVGFWSSMPGILTGLAALVAAVGGLYLAVHKPDPEPKPPVMSVLEYDTNRAGSDLKKIAVADIDDCLKRCITNEQCRAISFLEASKTCWLKGEVPSPGKLQGFTSAVKIDR